MDNATVTKLYLGSLDTVKDAAKLIGEAMHHEQFGSGVTERLPNTFQTDYEANFTALVKAISDQAVARGAANVATREQKAALVECLRQTSSVRKSARRALAGQNELLHSSFTVGVRTPQGLKNIVTRAEKVQAACVEYAEQLASKGWNAAATTALATAIEALHTAEIARHGAKDAQKGATANVVSLANAMYDLCRTVQIVAETVYPAAHADNDHSIVEARATFLLGEFPRRKRAADQPSAPPPPPATTTPGS